MIFSAEFFLSLTVACGVGVGVYAAIRADLATLHERTRNTEASAIKAHERLDSIYNRRS